MRLYKMLTLATIYKFILHWYVEWLRVLATLYDKYNDHAMNVCGYFTRPLLRNAIRIYRSKHQKSQFKQAVTFVNLNYCRV